MSAGAVEVNTSNDTELELMSSPDLFIVPGESSGMDARPGARQSGRSGSLVQFPVRSSAGSMTGTLRDAIAFDSASAYRLVKRSLDIVVALTAVILLIPLVIVVVATIRLTSPGPILFGQTRCGKDGRPFRLFKFRTMVTDAELIKRELAHLNEMSGPMFKVRMDPRITRVGRVLRRFSIDELPQLVNVLRGEMTLVGPRPAIVTEVEQFTPHQRRRLEVEPGLTCLWQVSGRSDLSFDEWVALDIEYIERRSVRLDLEILIRTIPAVVTGRGAY